MQDGEDTNSTLQSNLNEEDSKTGLDEDGFEVVTLESDYQVFFKCLYPDFDTNFCFIL